jgi:hypothetical protein
MKIFGCLCPVMAADDMLVLDVLNSLVNAPSKMSELEINIPSGQLLSLLAVHFFSTLYVSHVDNFLCVSSYVLIQVRLEKLTLC